MTQQFAENARRIRERVAEAAGRADRDPTGITIVAVSKTFPREDISLALEHGFSVFGESRVQEIRQKFMDDSLPTDATLHLIGPLQTNKIRHALQFIDVLETVDRPNLIDALSKEVLKRDSTLQVMLQVNVSGEEQKSGVLPDEAAELLHYALQAPGIQPIGLMTMAPYGADEPIQRAVFGGLRTLRDTLQESSGVALPCLSMGMSDDFEIAIEEGATHIRLGRSLFGHRELAP